MRWTAFAAVVLFLLSCGPELDPGPEQDLPDAIKAKSYALHTTDAVGAAWLTSFPIHTTWDVHLATDLIGAFSGHHTERVVVWMPSGAAYQALTVSFATDVPAAAGEQQAQRIGSGWRVWTSFPVAGTTIEEFNLAGPWSAGVWVDSATAANASVTFTLQ